MESTTEFCALIPRSRHLTEIVGTQQWPSVGYALYLSRMKRKNARGNYQGYTFHQVNKDLEIACPVFKPENDRFVAWIRRSRGAGGCVIGFSYSTMYICPQNLNSLVRNRSHH